MSYKDIDGEQEAERPVVFRGKGKNSDKILVTILILMVIWLIVLSVNVTYKALNSQISITALSLQAEQTGISAARDTQRIEALLTKQDVVISDLTALQKEWYGDGFPYLTTATQDCGGDCHE